MQNVIIIEGDPGTTLKHTCGDTAEDLGDVSSFVYVDTSQTYRKAALKLIISVEDNPIRFAFGTAPTQAGLGTIVYPAGTLVIKGLRAMKDFQFINHTNGANAVLQIDTFYNPNRKAI